MIMQKEVKFQAVTALAGDIQKSLVIVCDHATNHLPASYGSLGLPPHELERHIAYDIGVAGITLHLHQALNVPVVLSGFSRLLIDPNRGLDDPTLIMELSDGAIIPGNAYIPEQERRNRIGAYYTPYHECIKHLLDEACTAGHPPVLVSLHSFTPCWKGKLRPWHVSVLWDTDARFVHPLLAALREERDLVVGENEPYHGNLKGDCMYQHGTLRHLPHALVEIRQNLITTPAQQAAWAERLCRILKNLIKTL